MTPIHRRRKSDKYPSREVMLEQQRHADNEEILLLRATNTRLRTELARLRTEMETKPMELSA